LLAHLQTYRLRAGAAVNEDLLASFLNQDGVSLADVEEAYMEVAIGHGGSGRPYQNGYNQQGQDGPFFG